MNRVVSIDPGANGGIAVFYKGDLFSLHTIPKIGDNIDYRTLTTLLTSIIKEDTIVVLEEVHSVFGASAKSNFSFGHINGVLLGIVLSTDCAYTLVQPKEWQKSVWANQDKVFKPGKSKQTTDTKKTSLLAALRLFPKINFLKSEKSKVPHDGLIDAALIGKWYIDGHK